MKSIAIMQPYFIPYAGYFRLMQSSDVFVIYDCVQFTRRGYIHRNKLNFTNNGLNWLGLPLKKQPREIKINQLEFKTNALEIFDTSIHKSNIYSTIKNDFELMKRLYDFEKTPSQYITELLRYVCQLLNIQTEFIYSSHLNLPSQLRGQGRIIEICKQLNANHYINSSNGRSLYDFKAFENESIDLSFLEDYKGSYISVLEDYYFRSNENQNILREQIRKQSILF